MIKVLVHRGPDDSGLHADSVAGNFAAGNRADSADRQSASAGAVLGHRRLSIIDLDGGRQPLTNEDRSVWVVFNGEIYNYRELRRELEGRGHRFATDSDTEPIVHLYEEYGTDCVQHLRGMFAFALWDAKRGQLLLARDRLGQKPLIYRQSEDRLFFASELKALLQIPGAPRELDPVALDLYLTYQYVPHPRTILQGYHKLPPGHWALYTDGTLQVERYWSPPYEPTGETLPGAVSTEVALQEGPKATSEREWSRQLRDVLTEAVRLRLRSDVPLGAFLSGGIDSTIIVGLMQQLSQQPVHTFSIGFPVRQFDERSYAREAAEFLGTEHHEAVVEPEALQILPRLIWQYDEPFADSSAIPMMYLAQMTRQRVTVALSGDGGDELFAGYDRYRAVRLGERLDGLPAPLKRLLTMQMWQRLPASTRQKSFRRRLKRLLEALADSPQRRYLKWISIFDDQRRRALYTDSFRESLDGADAADFLLDAYTRCPTRDFVTRTTCADVLTYLPCDILTKVDIATMAYSLECRSPFLDHHVAELAARMPIELKQRGATGKRVLLETFKDLLPSSIQRRKKMGFGVPLDEWFRHDLKPLLHDTLLDQTSLDRGYFAPATVRRLVEEHTSGQSDHSYRLWSLLCFEMWQRTFLDPSMPPQSAPTIFST